MKINMLLLRHYIIALVLLALPAVVQAQFNFTTNNDAVTITAYTGPGGVVAIPNTTNGYTVTSIGQEAFYLCTNLTNIIIPEVVTNIGPYAFGFCTNLTTVFFEGNAPPDVGNAFYVSPTIVYYTLGTTGWGATFGEAPTRAVTPPSQFTWVTNNDAVSVTITDYTGSGGAVMVPPDINGYPVTSIGPEAFAFCTNLTSAVFAGNAPPDVGNAFYGDPDAVVYYAVGATGWGSTFGGAPTEEYTPPSQFRWVTNSDTVSITITGYTGPVGAIFIPPIINGYAVTGIAPSGPPGPPPPPPDDFPNATSVTIPNTVTNIGDYAFEGCSRLTNVIIPSSVTSIGQSAFENCRDLTNIAIPSSVTSIGEGLFGECTGLTNISVDSDNPSYSSLNGVLFDKSQDTLIAYPEGLTGTYAVPIGVTNIAEAAFANCSHLTSVLIPGSVTNIGVAVFPYCPNLESAYFEGNAPPDIGGTFYGDPVTVYYLPGTTGWGTTFGNAPTELWNPQATAFTTASGKFDFSITGPTNATIVVEACTNLANQVWIPVSTNTLSASGASAFSDPQWTNNPNRYYRFSAP